MDKVKGKKVIMQIENIYIVRDNSENLAIYRLEDVYNPFEKQTIKSFQFKGFYSTVLRCLEAIEYKELLIDENDCKTLSSYLKQIYDTHDKIADKIAGATFIDIED